MRVLADVGATAWVNGCPVIHRGGGWWTSPRTVLEMAEKFPFDRVPGAFTEIIYALPTSVPPEGRPLSVGALQHPMRGGR